MDRAISKVFNCTDNIRNYEACYLLIKICFDRIEHVFFFTLGITQKLDYLVDIGATAIWLTPFFKSPFRSSGYDISNYYEVHNVFGTMADLKELINNAHKKSINVTYLKMALF